MADEAYPLPGVSTISDIGQWEHFFYSAFDGGGGVIPGRGSEMSVTLNATSRSAVIAPGAAIVRAFYKPVTAATSTAIPAASSQNRIDRLVLRLNRTTVDSASFVTPVVITGTPAGNPQVPAVVQNDTGTWDLPLAHWTSGSDGSLSGLVDERQFLAAVLAMPSTAGLPSLDRAGVLIRPDTGQMLMSPAAGAPWSPVTPQIKRKSGNQSWPTGTGWNNDPDLVIPLSDPAGTYEITGMLEYDAGSVSLFQHQFAIPFGSNMTYACDHFNNSNGHALSPSGARTPVLSYANGPGAQFVLTFQGTIVLGGVAGNIQVQLANQNTGGAGPTLYSGSYIKAVKVTPGAA